MIIIVLNMESNMVMVTSIGRNCNFLNFMEEDYRSKVLGVGEEKGIIVLLSLLLR